MIAPCFSRGQLEQLAKLLGEEVTGAQLSLMLEQVSLTDQIEFQRNGSAFIMLSPVIRMTKIALIKS